MRSLFLLFLNLAPVVLEGTEFNALEADNEIVGEDDFEGKTGEERGGAEKKAEEVLLEAELNSLEGLATILNHGELDDDGSHQNDEEEFVVEEVLEDVVLIVLQLTSIDLVEHLQQHEDVEEDWVMLTGLIVPVAHSNRWGNAEEFRTYIGN